MYSKELLEKAKRYFEKRSHRDLGLCEVERYLKSLSAFGKLCAKKGTALHPEREAAAGRPEARRQEPRRTAEAASRSPGGTDLVSQYPRSAKGNKKKADRDA